MKDRTATPFFCVFCTLSMLSIPHSAGGEIEQRGVYRVAIIDDDDIAECARLLGGLA
jgi:hypothetical protein